MWTRVAGMYFERFQKRDDGALLVFFAICCAAIFLIAALSFDLGRRASTQTDLQSFADNVALAAAGELDGLPGSISRAQTAADQLIRDEFKFGNGDRTLSGNSDFTLAFYQDLPLDETAWTASLLADGFDATDDAIARFVRVQVNEVQVEWSFANILTVFGQATPSEMVRAEATAGYTSLACDIAPVFFCMPNASWDPGDHKGETILLRSGGRNAGWGPGNFGFLDVVNMTGYDVTDTAGPCYGLNGASLYNCLIGAESAITFCFENGNLELLPGQRNGISPAVLNTKFDMFNATNQQYEQDSRFRPAPIVTKKYETGSTCANEGEIDIDDATDFLPDDCFSNGNATSSCLEYDDIVRYGDGNWEAARMEYVDRNYSVDIASVGTVDPVTEIVTIDGAQYHVDDPFRPGDGDNPRKDEYAGFPVVTDSAWRWHYYNAEVAAAYYSNPTVVYGSSTPGEVDISNPSGVLRVNGDGDPAPLDLLDVLDADGNVINRSGTSLPHCASDYTMNPRRRTVVTAVVDCDAPYNNMNGSGTARAEYFIEVFIQSVAGGTTTNGDMSIYVEPISDPLYSADPSFASGVFRNLVQLYR